MQENDSRVKQLIMTYSKLMDSKGITYNELLLGEEIFEKPWLLECLMKYKGLCEYGGYRTFESLVLVVNRIEKTIGKIVKVYQMEKKDERIIALLAENNNKKFLISLGADVITEKQRREFIKKTPEQDLLEKIFGEKAKPSETDEYRGHKEYLCEINTEDEDTIRDILMLMGSIATHHIFNGDVSINPHAISYYLTSSNDICECSIKNLARIDEEKNKLQVSFYKIEISEDGKVKVRPMEEIGDFSDFLPTYKNDDEDAKGSFDFFALFDGSD